MYSTSYNAVAFTIAPRDSLLRNVQPSSGTHASYLAGTRVGFTRAKQPEREAHHSFVSGIELLRNGGTRNSVPIRPPSAVLC